MATNRSFTNSLLLGLIAAAAWFALGLQFYLIVRNISFLEALAKFFVYFTILTNLLVAVSTTILLLFPQSPAGLFFSQPAAQAAIAVYILIVGVVYNTILRPLWNPTGLQLIADELLHVAVPVLYVAYWLVFAPKHTLNWKHSLQWLLYPAIYFAYAMLRGAFEGSYAYPFINANDLGYPVVFRNAAGIMVLFGLIGVAFIFVSKKLKRH